MVEGLGPVGVRQGTAERPSLLGVIRTIAQGSPVAGDEAAFVMLRVWPERFPLFTAYGIVSARGP